MSQTVDRIPVDPTGQARATELALAFLRMLDERDLSRIAEIFAPDIVDHDPLPGTPAGIEGVRILLEAVLAAFSDIRHEVLFQAPIGDDGAVTVWRMTGRHTGEFLGVLASGRPVDFTGIDVVRVAGGRVVEHRHVENLLLARQQIVG
jgi:predicted ester cyclase